MTTTDITDAMTGDYCILNRTKYKGSRREKRTKITKYMQTNAFSEII